MEIANRYVVAYKGLKDGVHEFSFDAGAALLRSYGNEDVRDCRCRADVVLHKSQSALAFDVRISGEAVVPCDRCLEDCTLPVNFDGRLTVRFSDETAEYDGETMWLSPAETEVDLAQYIYESILLSLPYSRVHPDGECDPSMLARFTVATAEEFDRMEEAAERRQTSGVSREDMDKLAALKARIEERGAEESGEEKR